MIFVKINLLLLLLSITSCEKSKEAPNIQRQRLQAKTIPTNGQTKTFQGEAESSKDCSDPTIKTINSMPIDHGDNAGSTFSYRYQHIKVQNSKETVIYFPGGPGGDSIGEDAFKEQYPRASRIYIDPRGVGCNFKGTHFFNKENLTTENHAKDVVRIINDLQLRRYFIYGISYGTMVGTVAAYHAEKSEFPPTGVILEGVLGSVFDSKNVQTFDVEWNKIARDNLHLRNFVASEPLGYTSSAWAEIITEMLYYSSEYLVSTLEVLAFPTEFTDESYRAIKELYVSMIEKEEKVDGSEELFMSIGCQEIFYDESNFETVLQDGVFVKTRELKRDESCQGNGYQMKSPYDSRDYQLVSPIYYFQGANDPATPIAQARYHFDGQDYTQRKTWIEVEQGGHNPLTAHDQLENCSKEIWDNILALREVRFLVNNQGKCLSDELSGFDSGTGLQLLNNQSKRDLFFMSVDHEKVSSVIK